MEIETQYLILRALRELRELRELRGEYLQDFFGYAE